MADFEVHGYRQCVCGEFMADHPTKPAPALCPPCRRAATERATQARLTYEVQGHTFRTPAPKTPKKPKRPKKLSPAKADRRRRRDRAKIRAYVRLAAIYRPMFDLLYAEEKLKEGLSPVIEPTIPRTRADGSELVADVADALARAEALGGDEPAGP